ncbi:MAG TPA: DUF2750 domain-containing protein [Bacteroidetes bacterium]|nr:DUF2750 domain-containing protein [Bacteroidota bacterium]
MEINEQEFDSVIKLDPSKRYGYFIKRVSDWEAMYGLKLNGEWALSKLDEYILFPVWPHIEYAKYCSNAEWENHVPFKIDLDYFEKNVYDYLSNKNILIDVFPVSGRSGFVVGLDEFIRDINRELKHYS